jgi:TrmH family RNA methyltransferase
MITSPHNPRVKHVRELLQDRKHREQEGLFVIEGVRLVEEAMAKGLVPKFGFFSQDLSPRGQSSLSALLKENADMEEMDSRLLNQLSPTETSQGILVVLPLPDLAIKKDCDLILALDNLRDPGNLGTIMRTAAAFGVGALFLSPGTVDAFSPKVVRSSMGAHFKLPIAYKNAEEIQSFCKGRTGQKMAILGTDGQLGSPCWEMNLAQPVCLVIGSEAEGMSIAFRQIVDGFLCIPMIPGNESLNAAMAAGILCYEAHRQRQIK